MEQQHRGEGNKPPLETEQQRQKHTVEIRKQQREDILSKRRNRTLLTLQPTQSPSSDFDQKLMQFTNKPLSIHAFPLLIQKLNSPDLLTLHQGIIGLRKLVSIPQNNSIQDVVDINLIPKLIQFAYQDNYPRLKAEAAWILTNIASGEHHQCKVVVERGGIGLFVALLDSRNETAVEHAVWAIGNLASDCTENRDLLLKAGALPRIVRVVETATNRTNMFTAAWSLSNLCRGNPSPRAELTKAATGVICKTITENDCDMELVADCCWALYHLSNHKPNINTIVNCPNLCEKLTLILEVPDGKILMPTLRIVGTILSGEQHQSQHLTRYDILRPLQKLTHNFRAVTRKQTCWALSNFAAGPLTDVQKLINNASLITRLLELLLIVYTFYNIFSLEDLYLMDFMRTYQILKIMIWVLQDAEDMKLLEVTLKTIWAMLALGRKFGENKENLVKKELKELGGVRVIDHLQQSQFINVYLQAAELLEEFFEVLNPLEE